MIKQTSKQVFNQMMNQHLEDAGLMSAPFRKYNNCGGRTCSECASDNIYSDVVEGKYTLECLDCGETWNPTPRN